MIMEAPPASRWRPSSPKMAAITLSVAVGFLFFFPLMSFAHDVSDDNRRFVEALNGPAPGPFFYLGAKHMVTGMDHVLFLVGVVYFLRKFKDIVTYVSLFTVGHSLTLLIGVLNGIQVNPFMIDAIIGLSVVYKAFENLGGFKQTIGRSFDMRGAVFAFGLAHGLGLATKLQDLSVSKDGLLTNLISFNIGVEVGQVLVLLVIVGLLNLWRDRPSFITGARWANIALMAGGFILMGQHITGWIIGGGSNV